MNLNHRILVIDDNPAIHDDFRKIFRREAASSEIDDLEASIFGAPNPAEQPALPALEMDSAAQGQEGLKMVEAAVADGKPYALAFVDGRMPPGWDGIETIVHLWETYPDLQVVICTAYSDYSWEEIVQRVGHCENLVILKKPFDAVEVLQLSHALCRKWSSVQETRREIRVLNERLQKQNRELEESETRFLQERTQACDTRRADMAGLESMRPPIRDIEQQSDALLASGLDPERKLRAETIKHISRELIALLNEIAARAVASGGNGRPG